MVDIRKSFDSIHNSTYNPRKSNLKTQPAKTNTKAAADEVTINERTNPKAAPFFRPVHPDIKNVVNKAEEAYLEM